MTNQNKFWWFLVLLLGLTYLERSASAQTVQLPPPHPMTASPILAPSPPTRVPQKRSEDPGQMKKSLTEALAVIKDKYAGGKKLNYSHLFKSSIDGMLLTLDPQSKYFDAKEANELKDGSRRTEVGIGVTIGERRVGPETGIFIIAPLRDSPAAKADVHFGDRVIAVDNWDTKGHTVAEVRARLRGPRGSRVKLTIERAADGERRTLEILRAGATQPSLRDVYLLQPGVGYIDLRSFNHESAEEFAAELVRLKAQGMTSLVLDVRNNPGGLFIEAIQLADQFLPRGQVIVTQKSRSERTNQTYQAQNLNPDKSPLVVLVSNKTASGSEIMAGALQDHARALIVGEVTFGLSLVQIYIPLADGSGLLLTHSRFLTPSGRMIQRAYSSGGSYDYEGQADFRSSDEGATASEHQTGSETRTDTGRNVSDRGGLVPDEIVKARERNGLQQRLIDPIFGFARLLVNGKTNDFQSYKIGRPIDFKREIKPDEFPVTDSLFNAFKEFVAKEPSYQLSEEQLDANREFIARQMRYDISTAAYGLVIAARVLRADDPQVLKAIDVLPQAAALAAASGKTKSTN